jgi:hypothetical protein
MLEHNIIRCKVSTTPTIHNVEAYAYSIREAIQNPRPLLENEYMLTNEEGISASAQCSAE